MNSNIFNSIILSNEQVNYLMGGARLASIAFHAFINSFRL